MGGFNYMEEIKAISIDRDEDEVNTDFQKRLDNVQWGDLRPMVLSLGLMTLPKLYLIYTNNLYGCFYARLKFSNLKMHCLLLIGV